MKLCYHCMHQIQNDKAHFCPRCGKSLKQEEQPARFLRAGTLLGKKFIAGCPLGAGGFGNTYIGWDSILCRKVAIKEFYPEQYCTRCQDGMAVTVTEERLQPRFQRGLQQFLTEARNVAALHEVRGVVEITNFFEENGTGYIVMEYLEGMDVKTILQRSGEKKEYEWCRRVILTVLYTLRDIHRRGVLHRDIAPDNIFVTDEGVIKLIDFGAAKQVSALENTSDIMLKAGYAPIEQYSRELEQGPYTDLYAAAALFYRMLTGQKPIPAHERLERDSLIPPSEMGISIPEQAELAIMVCLNIAPEYRLQSADEFMEALDGKFFIPMYEPEWILPKVEENKGFFGRISSLSVAAKAALCFCGICIIGAAALGAAVTVQRAKEAVVLDSDVGTAIIMQDLRGKSGEEAIDYVEELNRMHPGWDIQLDMTDTVFDLTKEDGTVYAQSIEPGTVLYDSGQESSDYAAEGLEYDDRGGITGTMSLTLYSSEKIHYSEISGLNAYELAQKLSVDTADRSSFIAEEKEGENYYDLASLEVAGKTISIKDLCREANRDKEISYSKDIRIHYYATDFFYWDKLPDFVSEYGTIDRVPEQKVYRYTDEKTKEVSGSRELADSSLVDDEYCAIQSDEYEVGRIVGQTVKPGEAYDGSNPGDILLEVQVLGHELVYEGKTGKEFMEELAELGFGLYELRTGSGGTGNADWKIESVKVYEGDEKGGHTDKELDYFKSESKISRNVFFEIIVKKPDIPDLIQMPAPGSTPEPKAGSNFDDKVACMGVVTYKCAKN